MKMSKEKLSKTTPKMIFIVFISLLMDLLAFTMILPLFPSLLDHYKKNDSSEGLYATLLSHIRTFQYYIGAPDRFNSVLFGGFLGSMFSFLQFIISPLAGGLSDVFGRKPVLLICLVGISFSYCLWAISHNFFVFVIARIIGGLSKGNVSLSMAAITDVSTPSTRAAGMALVGIAFSIGFILGPLIGAGFTIWGQSQEGEWFVVPALFALLLSVMDIFFISVFFEETLPKEKRASSVANSLQEAASYINISSLFNFKPVSNLSAKDRHELKTIGLVYFVYLFIYSGLEFTLTFLTHHLFSYTAMKQGTMFFCIGLTMAFIQGIWVRKIPLNKVKGSAVMGLFIIVPSFACVGLASSEILLYVGLFLFAVSTAFVVPCMTTMVSQFGGVAQKGTLMGVFRSLGALARALGPIFASIAFWRFGSTVTYLVGSLALLWPWLTLKNNNIQNSEHQK